MKKLIALAAVIMLASCGQLRHYQKVATDTEVTPKEKATLTGWVATNFPSETKYIKGKDSVVETTVVDTTLVDSLSARLDSALRGCQNLNVDSLKKALLKEFAPKTKTIVKTRIDTIQTSSPADKAIIYALQRQNAEFSALLAAEEVKSNEKDKRIKEAQQDRDQRTLYLILSLIVNGVLLYIVLKPK